MPASHGAHLLINDRIDLALALGDRSASALEQCAGELLGGCWRMSACSACRPIRWMKLSVPSRRSGLYRARSDI